MKAKILRHQRCCSLESPAEYDVTTAPSSSWALQGATKPMSQRYMMGTGQSQPLAPTPQGPARSHTGASAISAPHSCSTHLPRSYLCPPPCSQQGWASLSAAQGEKPAFPWTCPRKALCHISPLQASAAFKGEISHPHLLIPIYLRLPNFDEK